MMYNKKYKEKSVGITTPEGHITTVNNISLQLFLEWCFVLFTLSFYYTDY